jgi:hypothetical protein
MLKFTLYTLSVLGFTSAGDGPSTQPIQLKTYEDVPGPVLALTFDNIYDTSVDVMWRPPQQPNGRIIAYVLECTEQSKNSSSSSGGSTTHAITVEAGANNYTLRSLRSATEYTVSVRARTAVGDGSERRAVVRTGVPAELPDAPQLVVVRQASSRSCELEFIPGYSGRTTIRQWIVEAVELSAYEAYLYASPTATPGTSSSSATTETTTSATFIPTQVNMANTSASSGLCSCNLIVLSYYMSCFHSSIDGTTPNPADQNINLMQRVRGSSTSLSFYDFYHLKCER